jgi:hypothetical protein
MSCCGYDICCCSVCPCCIGVVGAPCAGCVSSSCIDKQLNCCQACGGAAGSGGKKTSCTKICPQSSNYPYGSPGQGAARSSQGTTSSCILGPISNLGLTVAGAITGRRVTCVGGVKSLAPKATTLTSSNVLLIGAAIVGLVLVFGLGKK